jgi:hypothetical protein
VVEIELVCCDVDTALWLTASCPGFYLDMEDAIPRSCTQYAQHYRCVSFNIEPPVAYNPLPNHVAADSKSADQDFQWKTSQEAHFVPSSTKAPFWEL